MSHSAATLLLLAPPSSEGQAPNLFFQFAPFLLIFAIFYFLIFAPMRKKQKSHTEMLNKLRAGDRVVTSGGIHGTVVGVTDSVIQLRIADQVKIDVSKSAISAMMPTDD